MIYHEHITVKDYRRVGSSNQYWLWYFTPSKIITEQQIQPIESPTDEGGFHPFRDLVELIQIPVFESKTKDSIDFLISLDPYLSTKNLYQKNEFTPVIIGFNHMRLVSSTHHPKKCLCVEGLIDIIAEMNVDLLKNLI